MTETQLAIFHPEGQPHDDATINQLRQCAEAGNAASAVLCADGHRGYSQPIGGAVAYPEYISPSGVGYDIGCGNKAVATSLFLPDVKSDLPRIMDEVQRRISFGVGRPNNEPVDHEVFDAINRDAPTQKIRDLLGTARAQLGTVGSGNHYVDLFAERGTNRIWIGVHFGSRGFGHKIASGFLALAQGKEFTDHADGGEMDSPPVLLHTDSPLGYTYIEAMELAGQYAYAGRDVVVNKVLEILGGPAVVKEVHNHHNFAWFEEGAWVIRKGCTPLWPGQEGFVGGSMGDDAVIIKGDSAGIGSAVGEASLYSAPHGAGRVMSRTEAKGKQRKRVTCNNCGYTQSKGEQSFQICPDCMHADTSKVWITESEGKVDWKAVRKRLKQQGVELRGGDADEAPEAYKRLPAVIAAHAPYVEITHTLRPIGVAMAGHGTYDPFKE